MSGNHKNKTLNMEKIESEIYSEVGKIESKSKQMVAQYIIANIRKILSLKDPDGQLTSIGYGNLNSQLSIEVTLQANKNMHEVYYPYTINDDIVENINIRYNTVKEFLSRKIQLATIYGLQQDNFSINIINDLYVSSRIHYESIATITRTVSDNVLKDHIFLMPVDEFKEKISYNPSKTKYIKSENISHEQCVDVKKFLDEHGEGSLEKRMIGDTIEIEGIEGHFCLKYRVVSNDYIPFLTVSKDGLNVIEALKTWSNNYKNKNEDEVIVTDYTEEEMEFDNYVKREKVITTGKFISLLESVTIEDTSIHSCFLEDFIFQDKETRLISFVNCRKYIQIKRNIHDLITLPFYNKNLNFYECFLKILNLIDCKSTDLLPSNHDGLLHGLHKCHTVISQSVDDYIYKLSQNDRIPFSKSGIVYIKLSCAIYNGLCVMEEPDYVLNSKKDAGCKCRFLYESSFVPLDAAIVLYTYSVCPFCLQKVKSIHTVTTKNNELNKFEENLLNELGKKRSVGLHSHSDNAKSALCQLSPVEHSRITKNKGNNMECKQSYITYDEENKVIVEADFPKFIAVRPDVNYVTSTGGLTENDIPYMTKDCQIRFIRILVNDNYPQKESLFHTGNFICSGPDSYLKSLFHSPATGFLAAPDLKKKSLKDFLFLSQDNQISWSFNGNFNYDSPSLTRDLTRDLLSYIKSSSNEERIDDIKTKVILEKRKELYPSFHMITEMNHKGVVLRNITTNPVSHTYKLELITGDSSPSLRFEFESKGNEYFPEVVFTAQNITSIFRTNIPIKNMPPGIFIPSNLNFQILITTDKTHTSNLAGKFNGIFMPDPALPTCYLGQLPGNNTFRIMSVEAVSSYSCNGIKFADNYLLCPQMGGRNTAIYFQASDGINFKVKEGLMFIRAFSKECCIHIDTLEVEDNEDLQRTIDILKVHFISGNEMFTRKLSAIITLLIICMKKSESSKLCSKLIMNFRRASGICITKQQLNSSWIYGCLVLYMCKVFLTPLITKNWPVISRPMNRSIRDSIYIKLMLEFGVSYTTLIDIVNNKKSSGLDALKYVNTAGNLETRFNIKMPQIELPNGLFITLATLNAKLEEEDNLCFADFFDSDKNQKVTIDEEALNAKMVPSERNSFLFSPLWDISAYIKEIGPKNCTPTNSDQRHYKSETLPQQDENIVATNFLRVNDVEEKHEYSVYRTVLDGSFVHPCVTDSYVKSLSVFVKTGVRVDDIVSSMLRVKSSNLFQKYWNLDYDVERKNHELSPKIPISEDLISRHKDFFRHKKVCTEDSHIYVAITKERDRSSTKQDEFLPFSFILIFGTKLFEKTLSIGKALSEALMSQSLASQPNVNNIDFRVSISNSLINLKKSIITGILPLQLVLRLWQVCRNRARGMTPGGINGVPYGPAPTSQMDLYVRTAVELACTPYKFNYIDMARSKHVLMFTHTETYKDISLKIKKSPSGIIPKIMISNKMVDSKNTQVTACTTASCAALNIEITREDICRQVYNIKENLSRLDTLLCNIPENEDDVFKVFGHETIDYLKKIERFLDNVMSHHKTITFNVSSDNHRNASNLLSKAREHKNSSFLKNYDKKFHENKPKVYPIVLIEKERTDVKEVEMEKSENSKEIGHIHTDLTYSRIQDHCVINIPFEEEECELSNKDICIVKVEDQYVETVSDTRIDNYNVTLDNSMEVQGAHDADEETIIATHPNVPEDQVVFPKEEIYGDKNSIRDNMDIEKDLLIRGSHQTNNSNSHTSGSDKRRESYTQENSQKHIPNDHMDDNDKKANKEIGNHKKVKLIDIDESKIIDQERVTDPIRHILKASSGQKNKTPGSKNTMYVPEVAFNISTDFTAPLKRDVAKEMVSSSKMYTDNFKDNFRDLESYYNNILKIYNNMKISTVVGDITEYIDKGITINSANHKLKGGSNIDGCFWRKMYKCEKDYLLSLPEISEGSSVTTYHKNHPIVHFVSMEKNHIGLLKYYLCDLFLWINENIAINNNEETNIYIPSLSTGVFGKDPKESYTCIIKAWQMFCILSMNRNLLRLTFVAYEKPQKYMFDCVKETLYYLVEKEYMDFKILSEIKSEHTLYPQRIKDKEKNKIKKMYNVVDTGKTIDEMIKSLETSTLLYEEYSEEIFNKEQNDTPIDLNEAAVSDQGNTAVNQSRSVTRGVSHNNPKNKLSRGVDLVKLAETLRKEVEQEQKRKRDDDNASSLNSPEQDTSNLEEDHFEDFRISSPRVSNLTNIKKVKENDSKSRSSSQSSTRSTKTSLSYSQNITVRMTDKEFAELMEQDRQDKNKDLSIDLDERLIRRKLFKSKRIKQKKDLGDEMRKLFE